MKWLIRNQRWTEPPLHVFPSQHKHQNEKNGMQKRPSVVSDHRTNCFSTYFVLLASVINPIGKLWPILSWFEQTFCSQTAFSVWATKYSLRQKSISHNTNRKGTSSYQVNPFKLKCKKTNKQKRKKKNSSKFKLWNNLIRLSWKKKDKWMINQLTGCWNQLPDIP